MWTVFAELLFRGKSENFIEKSKFFEYADGMLIGDIGLTGVEHEAAICGKSITVVRVSENRHRFYFIFASTHFDEYLA
ncbi:MULTISPECIES: hypothetical protein [Paenibacillus]|uniref:Uncharacterized protein n=1 Tax=Paenibacillus cineris TaxID=237530 RepID=A0ABQ4LAG7_9BACL|nr:MULTISPECIES: hypothetical protein [Paenibacillus]GIO53574.1 hypothetical protein J21TS7_18920 [Paenibacillus cineris]